jgi:hypothetical protein
MICVLLERIILRLRRFVMCILEWMNPYTHVLYCHLYIYVEEKKEPPIGRLVQNYNPWSW